MESQNIDYKSLITEVIKKQVVILGPDIAILKARSVPGLSVSDDGTVTQLEGNEQEVLEKLIEEYVALSGSIIQTALQSVFEKYPTAVKNTVH